MSLGEASGQGWLQIGELGLAFLLSALVGFEREVRQKSAGLRTHTLVGFASALIMLVSKYGFTDVLVNDRIVLDPSRVAAQIVTGIGFIGGGLIFVRRDSVRGLTTAAAIWLTAAIGMACGAGLPILAVLVTVGHFIVVFVFPHVARRVPRSAWTPSVLQITYKNDQAVLLDLFDHCSNLGFTISRLKVERGPNTTFSDPSDDSGSDELKHESLASAMLEVQGRLPASSLAAELSGLDGIRSVSIEDIEPTAI